VSTPTRAAPPRSAAVRSAPGSPVGVAAGETPEPVEHRGVIGDGDPWPEQAG
jgi:hypothetical protein